MFYTYIIKILSKSLSTQHKSFKFKINNSFYLKEEKTVTWSELHPLKKKKQKNWSVHLSKIHIYGIKFPSSFPKNLNNAIFLEHISKV